MAKLTASQERELHEAFDLFDSGKWIDELESIDMLSPRSFGENFSNGIETCSDCIEYQNN